MALDLARRAPRRAAQRRCAEDALMNSPEPQEPRPAPCSPVDWALLQEWHAQKKYRECMDLLFAPTSEVTVYFLAKFRRVTQPHVTAEDLFQIWCAQVVHGFPHFEWRSSAMTWMNAIANRVIYNNIKNKFSQEQGLEELGESLAPATSRSSPISAIDRKRKKELLLSLMQRLTEEENMIIYLRFVKDFNFYEIADFLYQDRSKFNNVTQKTKRAIHKIRKEFLSQGW